MDQIFSRVAEKCGKADFLEVVREKAHYSDEDRELLWNVSERILAGMEDGAAFSAKDLSNEQGEVYAQEVVMTLGPVVDALQESFLQQGLLTEAFMVEVLGSEILLQAYAVYNAWVKEKGEYAVKRYHFLGTDNGCATNGISLRLEELPALLERSGLSVTCTDGYCMLPKKSVAFYAELTKDKSKTCEGICMGCGRTDCPNRMTGDVNLRGNRVLDRPLTYGYARILGL